jgi:hypothetical protein
VADRLARARSHGNERVARHQDARSARDPLGVRSSVSAPPPTEGRDCPESPTGRQRESPCEL